MNQLTPTSPIRNDEENARRLAKCTQEYDSLKEEKIRKTHDLERLKEEYEQACAQSREQFGTDDIEQLRQAVLEGWKNNTQAVDAFEANMLEIKQKLEAISQSTQTPLQPTQQSAYRATANNR